MSGVALVEDFNRRRQEWWQKRNEKYRAEQEARVSQRNPVASNVNLDCGREVVLAMTHWRERPDPDLELSEIMEAGNVAARAAAQELREMGYEIVEQEAPMPAFRDRQGRVTYTGRIDFKIVQGKHRIPVEVKNPESWMFDRLDTYQDLEHYRWTRKWRGQILLYLLQNAEPFGVILLWSKGRKKMIPVVLEEHLEDAELALRLGESAVEHVKAGTLPPYAVDRTVCMSCWAFGRCCNPPIEEQGATMINDPDFYQDLRREIELHPFHLEYDGLKKRNRAKLKAIGLDRLMVQDIAMTVKEVPVKGYEVAARVDRRWTIVRAGSAEEEGTA